MTLSWTAPASALTITDYIVQYRLGSSGSWTTFNDGTSGTPGAVVTGLTSGSAYEFQVAAVNSDGTGPYSSPVSVTVSPNLNATFASAATVPVTVNGLTAAGVALTVNLGYAPLAAQKLTLVNNTGTNAISGTFTGLAQNGTVTATYNGDTFTFQINYAGGDGNDITLTRVGGNGQVDVVLVSTLAGTNTIGFVDGTGAAARFNNPNGVAVDSSGNVYVADFLNHSIRKVTPAGVVTTLAGTNTSGFIVNGTGAAARFSSPKGVAVDSSGNVYVADSGNYAIRKVTAAGVVTTLAGTNTGGFVDGTGAAARFNGPNGVAVDSSGNVYVADYSNHSIRKVTAAGVVTTLAGTNTGGFVNATGTAARFNLPTHVAVDSSGNVYVADYGNHSIRKVTPAGVVTTLAGTNTSGFVDGTGTAARFTQPGGVAVDSSGNVYVADGANHSIRKVTAAGVVTTLAGTNTSGFVDGTGAAARFRNPFGVAVDGSGNVYVADYVNHRIRKVTADYRPILTLGAASQVGSDLRLTGTVNPNGFITTARFEYGTNRTNLNLSTNITLSPNNGTNAQAVTNLVSGLTPNITNFFRLTASNVDGVAVTTNGSFRLRPPQTITFNALPSKTYGDAVFNLTATGGASGNSVTYTSSNTNVATVSGSTVTIRAGGTTTITARQSGNTLYADAPEVTQVLTVDKKALTVTAENKSRAFGVANPTFTATYSGFVSGDSAANSLSGLPGYDCAAVSTSGVGPYAITPKTGSLSSSKYSFSFANGTLTVTPLVATLNVSGLAQTFNGSPASPVISTVPAGLAVQTTYNGSSNRPTAPGSYTVVTTITDGNYTGAVTNTLVISKAAQTISFTPLSSAVPLKDLTNVPVSAISSSGLPVTLSLALPSAASLGGTLTDGTGNLNNIQSTGTVTLIGQQAGDTNYEAASKSVVFDVVKNNQTLTFSNLSNVTYSNGLTVTLGATASSGLPVSYSVEGPATLSGSTLTVTGAGLVSVTADQAGDSVNNAAASLTRTFTVSKASTSLSFSLSSLPAVSYGDALVDLNSYLSGSPAGVTQILQVVSGPATIVGGVLTITGAGPVVIRAALPESDSYLAATPIDQTINVGKKALTITAVSTNRPAGQGNPGFQVSYSGLVGGDTLEVPAAVNTEATENSPFGSYDLTPSGASSVNYDISYATGTLTVTQASSAGTFTWGAVAPILEGEPLSSTQLNAVNPAVPGTISYSPGEGTVLSVGTNNVVAIFTPTDTSSYSTATLTNQVVVLASAVLVAADDSLVRDGIGGSSTSIPIAQLLDNDTYSTPTMPVLSLPSGTTVQGGTVTVDNGWVLYTSPAGLASSASDSFTYRITDSLGHTADATVTLTAGDYTAVAVNIVWVRDANFPGTGKDVSFAVTPNRSYRIYATSSLVAPISWQDLGGGSVYGGGESGSIIINDSGAGSSRFYKLEEYRP